MNTNESQNNTTTDIQQPTEQRNGLTDLEPITDVKGGATALKLQGVPTSGRSGTQYQSAADDAASSLGSSMGF